MDNFHLIIVHFPIALLTLYSILELIRFRWFRESREWFTAKLVLVVCGSLGTIVAWMTGGAIAQQFEGSPVVGAITAHAMWATMTLVFFFVLALLNLVKASVRFHWISTEGRGFYRKVVALALFVLETPLIYIVVLGGLAAISITGALGGSIAHGPDTDPIARIIYDIFVPK